MQRLALAVFLGALPLTLAAVGEGSFAQEDKKPNFKSSATRMTAPAKGKGKTVAVKENALPPGITTKNIQHTLDVVNMYRAKLKVPALKLDPGLTQFATAGSTELRDTPAHPFHTHYKRLGFLLPQPSAENQYYMFGTGASSMSVDQQSAAAEASFFAEGPENGDGREHGHYVNMVNPAYKYLGVGLVLDANGYLFLTNDFTASPVTNVPMDR
jgi:hypothetical protein